MYYDLKDCVYFLGAGENFFKVFTNFFLKFLPMNNGSRAFLAGVKFFTTDIFSRFIFRGLKFSCLIERNRVLGFSYSRWMLYQALDSISSVTQMGSFAWILVLLVFFLCVLVCLAWCLPSFEYVEQHAPDRPIIVMPNQSPPPPGIYGAGQPYPNPPPPYPSNPLPATGQLG